MATITRRSPDERVLLEWEDISYSVYIKDSKRSKFMKPVYKEKKVLKGLSGSAASRQLLAIMGPTGCGKTSLLNILASRVQGGGSDYASIQGKITVNGNPRNDAKFRSISSYVLQDDLLYAHLTVYETLLVTTHFYLPYETSPSAKRKIVEDMIADLGLVKASNTIIGSDKVRGVSGGERKRANIAAQLITDPAVLFLDEPTSGLDSFQAQSVMECMKNCANNGRLVISVIHQPRSSIFSMFDKLLLLSEGHTIFFGPASKAVDYFGVAGYPNPNLYNPADHFLDILSPDNRTAEKDQLSQQRIEQLATLWKNKQIRVILDDKDDSPANYSTEILEIGNKNSLKRTIFNFSILSWRAYTDSRRDIATVRVKYFGAIFFSLLLGGIYSNTSKNQKSIQNRSGFLFIVGLNQAFNGMTFVLNTFPREKVIMGRERANRAYDTTSYLIAKFVTELPINMMPPFIFGVISYWIVGLNSNPERFVMFFLIVMFEAVTAVALGLAISAFAPSVELATALGPPFLIIGLLFAGFYINVSSLPIVANWIPYISLIRWAFQALCINEYKGETFECDITPCYSTGEDVLKSLSFDGMSTGYAVLGISCLLVAYLIAAYVFLLLNAIHFLPLGHYGRRIKLLHIEN